MLASVRAQRRSWAGCYLVAGAGIRQFLSASNTHEVAQRVAPECRVVYVDNDPIVLTHARALLASSQMGATAYLGADLRDTGAILQEAARTLDFGQPVALMLGVQHCIPDENDPHAITARLLAAVPPGSYLTVAHPASDVASEQIARSSRDYNERAAAPVTMRAHAEVSRFSDGLELVEPGVVQLHRWRPDPGDLDPRRELANYGGVGQKP